MTAISRLNGVDAEALRAYRAEVERDSSRAERNPTVIARWAGAEASTVTSLADGATVSIGGPGQLNPMRMVLAALAACGVDLIVNRAALLGVAIEHLEVEASGHFNVRRYLGLDAPHGPGYDTVACTIRLRTRAATPAQLDELRRACEGASPVGDTLRRNVDLSITFDAE